MDIMMGFEFILEPFKYDFMVRSMYVAILVGIMLPLLGAYVINRNLGFMGDAMAHASFPGLVFGVMIGAVSYTHSPSPRDVEESGVAGEAG